MRAGESQFLNIRGLRYHLRHWPHRGAPKLFLLHGWMDVSASFQFLVDELRGDWDVYAPDWRGYGLTDWSGADSYWFPDYLADLDFLLDEISPKEPVSVVGHSLGGNVAALYAGVRTARVARLVNLEGFGLSSTRPEQAPERYTRWMDELHDRPQLRPYANFAVLEERLRASNSRLSAERAHFLARHWGKELGDGTVVLRGDPTHKIVNAQLYRYEEALACWRQVAAPVLWVEGAESETARRLKLDPAQVAERRAAFRNVRVATVADAGHMLHHDQPAAVAALIEEFCR